MDTILRKEYGRAWGLKSKGEGNFSVSGDKPGRKSYLAVFSNARRKGRNEFHLQSKGENGANTSFKGLARKKRSACSPYTRLEDWMKHNAGE